MTSEMDGKVMKMLREKKFKYIYREREGNRKRKIKTERKKKIKRGRESNCFLSFHLTGCTIEFGKRTERIRTEHSRSELSSIEIRER